MVLKNLTENLIVTKDLKMAESFMDQFLGLIKKSNPKSLLFKSRFGIHTFFLKESIDVVVLDSHFRVTKIKKNLKPYRIFFWNPRYFYVLELPFGTINKYSVNIGDQLSLN